MVNSSTGKVEKGYEVLREEYDSAFQQLADEARKAHSLSVEAAGEQTVEEAQSRVDAATAVYRRRRDALAEPLLECPRSDS